MELRTPLGNKDTLAKEVRKRRELCARIQTVFDQFGFEEVQTPALEYYQTYNQAFSNLQDRQMIKLFDENQDIVTMRMDMTVPIARLAATSLKNAKAPLRLSYLSEVWKVRKAFTGRKSQSTDCGVELIGSDDDAQILVCALEALKASGLKDYKLELSAAGLLQIPAHKCFSDPEDIAKLADLTDRKSMVELGEFLDGFDLDKKVRNYFMNLPLLDGGLEVFEQAEALAFDPQTVETLKKLETLGCFLAELGYGDYIQFDLGKLPHLNYYTGVIFEAFVPGVSSSVLSGGRYDNLMASFGRPLPAIGFAFKIDPLAELLDTLSDQEIEIIRYPSALAQEAFAMAADLRKDGPVAMLLDQTKDEIVVETEVRP